MLTGAWKHALDADEPSDFKDLQNYGCNSQGTALSDLDIPTH